MDKKEELKKQLKELEKKEKKDRIQQELDRMRKSMPAGTCYASHQLSRYMGGKKAYNFTVIKIGKPVYNDREWRSYEYETERVHVYKDGNKLEISRGKSAEESPGFKYEITEAEFNDVYNGLVPGIEKLLDEMRMRHKAVDYVSEGKHSEDAGSGALLKWAGYEWIDFEEENDTHYVHKPFTTVFEVLRWDNHPYLFNKRLYKAPMWKEMVHRIADEMEKDARSWGGSIWEKDYPRFTALRKFIKQYE